jgi:hypothetical protein
MVFGEYYIEFGEKKLKPDCQINILFYEYINV